jgi:hypothetical protein
MVSASQYLPIPMSSPIARYRITLTPVEGGGLPCSGRCSIEFDQADTQDWMRRIEQAQQLRGLAGDERTALAVGASLLDGLARRHPELADDPLAGLRQPLAALLERLRG